MREKIKNTIHITCTGIDLTTVTNIEFYVRQVNFFGCYSPTVISPSDMVVVIPFEDAYKLKQGNANVQFAYTDENGVPQATESNTVSVGELLKEKGYDPI